MSASRSGLAHNDGAWRRRTRPWRGCGCTRPAPRAGAATASVDAANAGDRAGTGYTPARQRV